MGQWRQAGALRAAPGKQGLKFYLTSDRNTFVTAATTLPAHASAPLPRGLSLILRFLTALLHTSLGRCLRPEQVCRICMCLAGTTSCPYALALEARPAPPAAAAAAASAPPRAPRPRPPPWPPAPPRLSQRA